MEFLWSCMVISFKGGLGLFLWMLVAAIVMTIIALISFFLSGEWKKSIPPSPPKHKYKGQPIVIKGGVDNKNES